MAIAWLPIVAYLGFIFDVNLMADAHAADQCVDDVSMRW